VSEPDIYTDHVANLFSDSEETQDTSPSEAPSAEPDGDSQPSAPSSSSVPADSGAAGVESVNWEVVARGRLREIDSLRESSRETRERMAELERNFKAMQANLYPEEGIPEELLAADPALKYITGKLQAIEGQLQTGQRSQQEEAQFRRDVTDTVRYAQSSRQAFVAHTPAWDDAYRFMRQRFAEQNGRVGDPGKDEWLNVQEHLAVKQWRENGEDPALKIYEMAVANGWKPGQATVTSPPPAPSNGNGRLRRVREAVAAPSPASIGTRDFGSDVMSREQFYDQFPQQERVRIFNSERGEDIFESLMKTGRVSASLLPRQR
jgi:hypothetical protein